jgi:hypothetical protein
MPAIPVSQFPDLAAGKSTRGYYDGLFASAGIHTHDCHIDCNNENASRINQDRRQLIPVFSIFIPGARSGSGIPPPSSRCRSKVSPKYSTDRGRDIQCKEFQRDDRPTPGSVLYCERSSAVSTSLLVV